jgi:hypothetical protein
MKSFPLQSGFALLYAVLLTGIILAIGLGLSSIIAKQIILSSTGANSQLAYYAANSAKECVIHWGIFGGPVAGVPDRTGAPFGYFVYDIDEGYFYVPPEGVDVYCGSQTTPLTLTLISEQSNNDSKVYTLGGADGFEIGGVCVKTIIIVNNPETNQSSEVVATGYNTSCDNISNLRSVEREIVGRGNFISGVF